MGRPSSRCLLGAMPQLPSSTTRATILRVPAALWNAILELPTYASSLEGRVLIDLVNEIDILGGCKWGEEAFSTKVPQTPTAAGASLPCMLTCLLVAHHSASLANPRAVTSVLHLLCTPEQRHSLPHARWGPAARLQRCCTARPFAPSMQPLPAAGAPWPPSSWWR